MADINVFTITGRCTSDAKFAILSGGKSVLNVDVAVNTGYGEYKKVTYVQIQQWGDKGRSIVEYLKKGQLIGCTGELTTDKWNGQDGKEHTSLKLTTFAIQLLGSKKEDNTPAIPDGLTF